MRFAKNDHFNVPDVNRRYGNNGSLDRREYRSRMGYPFTRKSPLGAGEGISGWGFTQNPVVRVKELTHFLY